MRPKFYRLAAFRKGTSKEVVAKLGKKLDLYNRLNMNPPDVMYTSDEDLDRYYSLRRELIEELQEHIN